MRAARLELPAVLGGMATLSVASVVLLLLGGLVFVGAGEVSPALFYTAPLASGRGGGLASVLVSTLLILSVSLAAVIPLGLGTALCLSELLNERSLAARAVRYALGVLASVPSIVYALFGYRLFVAHFGLGFSILAGGLTLACMALPLMAHGSELALRTVPLTTRAGGMALGLSRSGMLRHVVLPQASPGIATAVVLSIGRALAETAALLYTAGSVLRMPGSVRDSGRSLSVHVYELATHVPGGEPRAAATALVLVALVVMLNVGVHRILREEDPSR